MGGHQAFSSLEQSCAQKRHAYPNTGYEALWLGGMLVIGRVRQTILFEGSPLPSEPIGLPKELEKKSNEVERQAFLV